MTAYATATSDVATPGNEDHYNGWRVRWTSRRRRSFAVILPPDRVPSGRWDRTPTELHEPVLILSKPGRKTVEVTGEAAVDRPVMLARGMTSAMRCDAHFAREWGDAGAALRYEIEAEGWHRIAKLRATAAAVHRAGARMIAGPAGSGAEGS